MGRVELAEGTKLRNNGTQLVKNGARLMLSWPGGGGYGSPKDRDKAKVTAELHAELITAR